MKYINYLTPVLFTLLLTGLFTYTPAQSGKDLVKSFKVSEGDLIQLTIEIGSIDVSTGNANEVKLIIENGAGKEENLNVDERPGNLQLDYNNRRDHFGENCELIVPRKCSIVLETTAGNIELYNDITGSIDLNTSGGNIEFQNVAGTVKINTSGGNIDGKNIDSDAEIHTSGGSIVVGDLNGVANIRTAGGNIETGNIKKRADLKTSGGNIYAGNIGGDAEIRTAGGNISVGDVKGSVDAKTAGGNIKVMSALGDVNVRTAGGNLILHNITGMVIGKTAAGNIQAELNPGNKGSSKLSTSVGDLLLMLPADAKATIIVEIVTHDFGWDEETKVEEYLQSDFEPTQIDIKKGKIEAVYQINGGGQKIEMETYMGKIQIQKK